MSKDLSKYRVTPETEFEEVDLNETEVYLKEGRRLTEDLAEQLAEETLRRVGRPSLSGAKEHSPHLGVRVSPELNRRVRARAAAEGKRPSDIVREALEHYL
jgi:predicted HicB family RNase H-like nuclease